MSFEKCGICSTESLGSLPQCPRCGITKSLVTQASKATEIEVVKAVEGVMKSYASLHKRANDLFQSGLESFRTANPNERTPLNKFIGTSEGADLYRLVEDARKRTEEGPVEYYTKALDAEIAEIENTIAANVEDFSVAHNLEPKVARARLQEISPSFAKLAKRHDDARNERMEGIQKARRAAESWHRAETVKAAREEYERQQKQVFAKLRPSQQAFETRVAEIMATRKCDRQKAIVWGAENDQLLRSLNETIRHERGGW